MDNKETDRYGDTELVLGPHIYRGRSVGSEQTCHQFPGFNVCIDLGGAPLSATNLSNVFVTHGHEDHCGGMVKHAIRRNGRGLEPAAYYCQESDQEHFQALMAAQERASRVRSPYCMHLQAIAPGDEVEVGGRMFVRPFQSVHKIPCQGYALWSKRPKLRPELADLPGAEIARRRREGVEVSVEVPVPEIAFPGDTSIRILEVEAGEVVRKARVLLLECTFIDGEVTQKDAYRAGHVHIDDIVQRAEDFQNEVILLTHFSARYPTPYIRETVTAKLAGSAIESRVQLLLPKEST